MLKPYRRAELSFDFVTEIGHHGHNSRTFVARDHQLSADIVIKSMEKTRLDAARYFAEAQALYASSHPNVVQVHYACEDADCIYVAMPHYKNKSLKDLLANGHLTVREVVTLSCQVLAGLQHVHSKGLVHFDVKPDNVLISDRGEALLSDFGLARPIGPRGLAEYDFGYVRTQPPEGFKGYEFPRTFDIYQVGTLLYRMCCGNDAFEQQFSIFIPNGVFDRNAFQVAVVNGQFPDSRTFPQHIPEKLRNVVRRCLATNPNDRFQSALEVANALAPIDGPCLDWKHSRRADSRHWEKRVGDMTISFEWFDDGRTVCYKTRDGGSPRRFRDGCTDRMTDRQVRTFLGDS